MSDTSYGFGVTTGKMNSMSGTLSSENESIRNDMSYLYGRDPSILAYGQRPFPSEESKKNLYSLLEEKERDSVASHDRDTISTVSTSTAAPVVNQTIKVFLRMKPLPSRMKLTNEQLQAYTVLNSTTLMTKMPSSDNNSSCLKKVKAHEMVCRKFMFSKTFGAETTQLELFDSAVKPQMSDFLTGKSSIVMSYGTTNSGKTYTLQGTPESPGIIPRGIEFVFGQINPRGMPCYKPINLCDVVYLNSLDRSQEIDAKMRLLALNPGDKNIYVSTYNQMQKLLIQESPMRPNRNQDAQYSVWISFAEIYNETIYDLLWNDCQKKRPTLKLATDVRGRTFIKGLKSICVSSGAEAYQVLMAGQYNLKVAATALNSRSSRSHCIFTIKLLKYRNEHDPSSVEVSMFAFCDLAGSERLKKTLNVGERLKEAQNINTSLLVLGRCLKTIYESQNSKHKNESIGPFRESKLTRLFQRALSGKEQLALIVNVNPVPNLYIETQNVLNFSAIAKKIVIERPTVAKRRHSVTRFSRLVTQSMKTEIMDWENTELEDESDPLAEIKGESDIEENDQEDYEELLTENEILKKENKDLKQSLLTKEMQTRQEMTEVYAEIMKKLEADWKNRLTDMEEQQEDLRDLAIEQIEHYYKDKLSKMHSRKRSRSSMMEDDEDEENDGKDDDKYIEDLEAENTKLTTKTDTLKKMIRDLKQAKDTIETEKTKLSFELEVAKEEAKRASEKLSMAEKAICTDDASAEYINNLIETNAQKDERIKKMKIFLNEAKEEYIEISGQASKMEGRNKILEDNLTETMEHIHDLEEQLCQANAYSSEQSKIIEELEDELEQHTKKLILAEEKIQNLSKERREMSSLNEQKKNVENQSDDERDTFIETLKTNLEVKEKEIDLLKQKLNEKIEEIDTLTSKLDVTKNQLDVLSEKVSNLSIDNSKQKKYFTAEQEVQTEINKSSVQDESKLKLVNVSLQTVEVESSVVETDEKCQQTSIYLNKSYDKEEIIKEKNIIIKANEEAYNELEKHFEQTKEVLDTCRAEKLEAQECFEDIIKALQTQITGLKVQMDEKNEKIIKMQAELCQVLQRSKEENDNWKELSSTQEIRCKELSAKIEEMQRKEQDKESEIKSLQKEMKILIRSNEETIMKMEGEVKNTLSELTTTKEKLVSVEERSKKMDKDYRSVVEILEKKITSLEGTVVKKQLETEKLEQRVEELKKALHESEMQLEVFEKNRHKIESQYEAMVLSRNEELNILRVENKKFNDLLQEVKENTNNANVLTSTKKTRRKPAKINLILDENTSEDDHTDNSETDKSKKKLFLTPKVENTSVEAPNSESKQLSSEKHFLAPVRPVRRVRKKLYSNQDDSYTDIEQSDPSPPPKSETKSTRSLRNRKK